MHKISRFIILILAISVWTYILLYSGSKVVTPDYTLIKNLGPDDIYLSSTIESEDNYRDLIVYLDQLPRGSEINLHLAGNGGHVSGGVALINAFKRNNHIVTAIVNGNLYSMHAVIAINTSSIVVKDRHANMMFHIPAISMEGHNLTLKQYCALKKGYLDRTIDSEHKCLDHFEKYTAYLINTTVMQFLIIGTKEEVENYLKGFDVYIPATEVVKRREAINGIR